MVSELINLKEDYVRGVHIPLNLTHWIYHTEENIPHSLQIKVTAVYKYVIHKMINRTLFEPDNLNNALIGDVIW